MIWSDFGTILKQAGDTSALLSPYLALALIGVLVVKEMLSGIDNPPVRRLTRTLTLFTIPLLIVFVTNIAVVIIERIFANIS
jgi:hypothetical protein